MASHLGEITIQQKTCTVEAVSSNSKAFIVTVKTNPERAFLAENDQKVPSKFSATGTVRYKDIKDLDLDGITVTGTIGKTKVTLAIGDGDDVVNVNADLDETKDPAVSVFGTGSWSSN